MLRSIEYFLFCVLLLCCSHTHAYSGGAGTGACSSLIPSHPGSGQTSDSPFAVILSKYTYSRGETIDVTLEARCGEQFKGFLLQARRAEPTADTTELIGEFTPIADTRALCANSATPGTLQGLTHSSATPKTSLTVRWTAPSTAQGHVIFRCTFVKAEAIYWIGVTSGVVTDPSAPALSVPESSIVSSTMAPCTTESDTPTTSSAAPSSSITRNKGCGVNRGCFDDCATGCTFTVSWAEEGNNVRFRFRTTSSANSYMALGFSSDTDMGADSVTECVSVGGVVKVFQSYNDDYSNSRLANPEDGISDVSGSFVNNVFSCSFLRVTEGTADAKSFNLSKDWYLLFADGPANADFSKSKHSRLPIVSSSETDMQSFTVNGAMPPDFPLVKAHGCLMTLAWLLCTGVGLVIARFYKPMWPDKTIGGTKIWFQVHRACMVATVVFTVVAFILIFIEAEGYSKEFDKGYQNAHPILGIIVTLLVILNPVMAFFRPNPTDSKRPIFNWAHFLVGKGAHIVAVIVTFFGLTMDKANVEDAALYVLAVYCVWQALVEICLDIVRWRANQKQKKATGDVTSGNLQMTDPATNQQSMISTINNIVLLVHVCVVAILSFTLVGLVASA